MVKTKKGRQTNNSKGRKRAPPTNLPRGVATAKKNAARLDELDVTTLADDDPAQRRNGAERPDTLSR